jgi:hypothetical protein
MGLLDAWSRRALERREGRVEFLGEQSGPVEDTLKREHSRFALSQRDLMTGPSFYVSEKSFAVALQRTPPWTFCS